MTFVSDVFTRYVTKATASNKMFEFGCFVGSLLEQFIGRIVPFGLHMR